MITAPKDSFALRARFLLPVAKRPVAHGVVTVVSGRIAEVGQGTRAAGVVDLGEKTIVPAFVNPHTHLEFSNLDQPFPATGTFADWLRRVIACRLARSGDAADVERVAVAAGLREAAVSGTAAVGEIATSRPWPDAWRRSPVSGWRFWELIGLSAKHVPGRLAEAEDYLAAVALGGCRAGLSPHAPYSASPQLVQASVRLASQHKAVVAMHLAETREELELLSSHTGPLRQLLEDLGTWHPEVIPRGARPLDYLRVLATAPHALVAHGNYLADDERDFLARRAGQLSLVYCPRTHAHFRHDPYPLAKLLRMGVHVAIGSDSRASSPNLDLLEDLKLAVELHPEVPPCEILRLGTLAGAQALDLAPSLGSIEPGKRACLLALSVPGDSGSDPHEALFDDRSRVTDVWQDGVPCVP